MIKLYDHQEQSINFLQKNKYAILELDTGLGKSLAALTFIKRNKLSATIVIPKYLQNTWFSEVEKFYPGMKGITFVPYSALEKNKKEFKNKDAIVLDESTMVKNPSAIRSNLICEYIEATPPNFLALLTATPILNRIPDFYTQLYLVSLKKGINGHNSFAHWNFYKFCGTFSNAQKTQWGTKYTGVKNLDLLKEMTRDKIIKFNSEDVLNLPDVSMFHITSEKIQKSADQQAMWMAYAEGKISKVKAESALLKTATTINKALEIIESGKKVIIFTDHVLPAKAIAEGLGVPAITGATDQPTRDKVIAGFRGETMAFVATSGTSSMGLNLQFASHMIFNDCPYQPQIIKQCIGRIKRIGQKNKCFVYFINSGKMDLLINKTLESKTRDLEKIQEKLYT